VAAFGVAATVQRDRRLELADRRRVVLGSDLGEGGQRPPDLLVSFDG
jgi:hypothetical protein